MSSFITRFRPVLQHFQVSRKEAERRPYIGTVEFANPGAKAPPMPAPVKDSAQCMKEIAEMTLVTAV
jgi:hypothetical protein